MKRCKEKSESWSLDSSLCAWWAVCQVAAQVVETLLGRESEPPGAPMPDGLNPPRTVVVRGVKCCDERCHSRGLSFQRGPELLERDELEDSIRYKY